MNPLGMFLIGFGVGALVMLAGMYICNRIFDRLDDFER